MRSTMPTRQRARSVRKVCGRADRNGATATELAICIPLLLLILFASVDFGRIAAYRQVVCNAARTGAEIGATHKFTEFTEEAWKHEVRQAALDEMNNLPGFDADKLVIDLDPKIDDDGLARIYLRVTYPFHTMVSWPLVPTSVMLQSSVEFRQFR